MGRRTSSGRIGAPTFGGLLAADNTTITTDDNADIILDPTGSGRVIIDAHTQLQTQSSLRFADSDSSNYVAFQGPSSISSDITWTLPDSDGSNGQALVTNGAGNLSWESLGLSITDDQLDSNTNYIPFTTTTSGSATDFDIAVGKLEFVPSTGTLTVDNLSAGTITETSSIAYKQNIQPIENALETISHLRGVRYTRKDTHKVEAGLIAEEVYDFLPEIVSLKQNKPDSIGYTRVIAYLIESIKELKAEIEKIRRS